MYSNETLIFFCGKMGSGKTTLSFEVAKSMGAIRLSEDDWLAALYPTEIEVFNDYIKYSSRLKPLLNFDFTVDGETPNIIFFAITNPVQPP
jgi:adenylate kinase family enzyme